MDKKDAKLTDWLIVILTAVLAIVSWLQWHEIHSGSIDTHRLAVAAAKQADAAKKAADTEKSSLDISTEEFKKDQRAWIGPAKAIGPTKFSADFIRLGVVVSNFGKTPAKNVVSHIDWNTIPANGRNVPRKSSFTFRFHEQRGKELGSLSVIYPSMEVALTADRKPTAKESNAVRSATKMLYLFGHITYADAFNVRHFSDFCLYYEPDLSSAHSCPVHNDAN